MVGLLEVVRVKKIGFTLVCPQIHLNDVDGVESKHDVFVIVTDRKSVV